MTDKGVATDESLLPEAFRDRAILRPVEVFRLLGISTTLGWELINTGALTRVQIGPRAIGVPVGSVVALIKNGLPRPEPDPTPDPAPPPKLVRRPR